MEISTFCTPEVASEYVPQKPFVAHPAFHPDVLYVPPELGKLVVEDGAAVSTVHV
jgi:hypothetical protein